MNPRFESLCMIGAAAVVAAAGIADLIDQNTMIILIIVLTISSPSTRRRCWPWKA